MSEHEPDRAALVRRSYEALNRGDLREALDVFDPDAEHDWSGSIGPYQGIYRGRDEALAFWTTALEAFAELTIEVEETLEIGPHLIVVVRTRARGAGSGAEAVATGAHLWTFGNGKAIRFRLCQTREEALAAAKAG